MKPSDIFGIIVRTSGVWFFTISLWYLLAGVMQSASPEQIPEENQGDAHLALAAGVSGLMWSTFLMRYAHWFVRFCYKADKPATRESSE